MNSIATKSRPRATPMLQYFFWLHPEWWTRALCGLAWTVLLLRGWQHDIHHRMTFGQDLAQWTVMVAAMMLPLVIHSVWRTAISSLWARRHRAIAGFLAGYFGPWLAFGIAIAAIRQASWIHSYLVAAAGFVVAAVWQLTPMHRRAVAECHRTLPLAPTGWRAHRDCLRFGGNIGIACLLSCWPLMMACALAGHSLVAIVGGMSATAAERWWGGRAPTRAASMFTLVIATYYAVLAALR